MKSGAQYVMDKMPPQRRSAFSPGNGDMLIQGQFSIKYLNGVQMIIVLGL
jgi:hypothetical protein